MDSPDIESEPGIVFLIGEGDGGGVLSGLLGDPSSAVGGDVEGGGGGP